MGSTAAGVTYPSYSQLIRSAAHLANSSGSQLDTPEVGSRVKWDPRKESEAGGDAQQDEPIEPVSLTKKVLKTVKILLPHVGLIVLLLSFISFGAMVFIWLEAEQELRGRRLKLEQVLRLHSIIINQTMQLCSLDRHVIEHRIRPLLFELSRKHEYDERFTVSDQIWTESDADLQPKWSFAAAVLYALTIITSTGYDHVTPTTDAGRLFTVFFGLVGIPLMFITAADIGKFLSEIVIRSYGKLLQLIAFTSVQLESLKHLLRRRGDEGDDEDSVDSGKRGGRSPLVDEDELDEDGRLQLPLASYFALIIGYCAIGSLLFNAFERGPIWSFIHGLFFSFNTITTIGLGNIYVRNQFYLGLVVAYVIIGLAVITASLDLCSSTLKRTFQKLHYFGRKIRGARRGFANMSDDIREAMKLIAALKKTRLSKDRITLEDLRHFLEVQEHYLRQPFVPYNVHIFRWIEDAYLQYFDSELPPPTGPFTGVRRGKNEMTEQDPIIYF